MNILLYRYGSICEPDIISGFEELGFSVDTITEEIYDKSIDGRKQICLLQNALDKKNYQFVFTINFFPAISEICNIYKIPYLCLIVDSPVMELYSASIANKVNRIFLFDEALYQDFRPITRKGFFTFRWRQMLHVGTKQLRRLQGSLRRQFVSVSLLSVLFIQKNALFMILSFRILTPKAM